MILDPSVCESTVIHLQLQKRPSICRVRVISRPPLTWARDAWYAPDSQVKEVS
uniref:Uncharacterized protein n=1 Tax=Myoviridae sp. ctu2j3 TaxID=2825197 RepID=A0A8S5UI93_9CAUD|nr:MAG TPA: hypothetical protein [Myoviridae sp. ctu2j3]DAF94325.1 MAG TPA: hypothetical protein [Myoviridae sp. ctu2j3]